MMLFSAGFDATVGALLFAVAVFFLAGIVKGVIGLGLPTVAMALLVLIVTPAQAAALLIVPSLVTNIWQLRPWNTLLPLLRRLTGMQLGVCAGTLLGALVLGAPASGWAMVSLGAVLIAYGGWSLSGARVSVPPGSEPWLGPVMGALTGLVTAATGIFVVPAIGYLQALGLERDELIQAMGISFTVSTMALLAGLNLNASYSLAAAGISLSMVLPALAGMAAGQYLRHRLSAERFRRSFLGSMIVLGAYLILKER